MLCYLTYRRTGIRYKCWMPLPHKTIYASFMFLNNSQALHIPAYFAYMPISAFTTLTFNANPL